MPDAANTPTVSPGTGTYATTTLVTITGDLGMSFYYTTDGTPPTSSSIPYSGGLSVASTTIIKAIAVGSGLSNSAVAAATLTITPSAAAPVFSVGTGTYATTQTVGLISATASATIYYTTDGSSPSSSSATYSTPLSIPATTTIKAIAVKSGMSNSTTATAIITIGAGGTPTFSVNSMMGMRMVTINSTLSGATIRYTTDNSTPTATSPQYSSTVFVGAGTIVKAIAIAGTTTSGIGTVIAN